ncbi:MAG: hypothetical protein UY90_C0053G0008, partial [Candidatus Peregrinibacteria bacterium GW2011_GWA2_54_9]
LTGAAQESERSGIPNRQGNHAEHLLTVFFVCFAGMFIVCARVCKIEFQFLLQAFASFIAAFTGREAVSEVS